LKSSKKNRRLTQAGPIEGGGGQKVGGKKTQPEWLKNLREGTEDLANISIIAFL